MPAAQAVSSGSLDGTHIKALVFHPVSPANDQASRGTIIALHGCSGLCATTGTRKGQLNARHQAMVDLLVAEGYNAVFPDSLSPRGETELCTQKSVPARLTKPNGVQMYQEHWLGWHSAVGAEVNLYADSHPDFDSPAGEVRLRKDVPDGVNPGQGVHVEPNPAAREQAYMRLRLLLLQAFKSDGYVRVATRTSFHSCKRWSMSDNASLSLVHLR